MRTRKSSLPPLALLLAAPSLLIAAASSAADRGWRWLADGLEELLHAAFAMEAQPPIQGRAVHVVVALGYRLREDGSPSALLWQRMKVAKDLASRHRGWLALSGGVPPRRAMSEAEVMLEGLRRCHSIGVGRVLLENASRTTRENSLETVRLIRRFIAEPTRWPTSVASRSVGDRAARRKQGIVLTVVSNRFHQPRACRSFVNAVHATASSRNSAASSVPIEVRCASVPPSSVGAPVTPGSSAVRGRRWQRGARQEADAQTDHKLEGQGEWCRLAWEAPDPREVVLLVLRELPALAIYLSRGWL